MCIVSFQLLSAHEQVIQMVEEVGGVLGEDVIGDSVDNEELERELQALLSSAQTSEESAATQGDHTVTEQLPLNARTRNREGNSSQIEHSSVSSGQDKNSNRERQMPLLT